MNGLEWIDRLFSAATSVLPHVLNIPCTHKGVAFTFGRCKALEPGIHVYWPIVTTINTFPIKLQTIDLKNQKLTTSCGQTVAVRGFVAITICDILKALSETWDIERVVVDKAEPIIRHAVESSCFDELTGDPCLLDDELLRELQPMLLEHGVQVECMSISSLSKVLSIAIWSDHDQAVDP